MFREREADANMGRAGDNVPRTASDTTEWFVVDDAADDDPEEEEAAADRERWLSVSVGVPAVDEANRWDGDARGMADDDASGDSDLGFSTSLSANGEVLMCNAVWSTEDDDDTDDGDDDAMEWRIRGCAPEPAELAFAEVEVEVEPPGAKREGRSLESIERLYSRCVAAASPER